MTVKQDLQKALAAAKLAQGTYATFAESTSDQALKQAFQNMEKDTIKHIMQLNHRMGLVQESENLTF